MKGCGVSQFVVVKVSEAVSAGAPDDATRTSLPAGASACTVTVPVGSEVSLTVYCSPAVSPSVTVTALGESAMPRTSSSRIVRFAGSTARPTAVLPPTVTVSSPSKMSSS